MKIETALHELVRIALEVTPFIEIDEAGGRDPRPCRQIPQGRAIRDAERLIDRLELVVLIFAHCRSDRMPEDISFNDSRGLRESYISVESTPEHDPGQG
ncbi:hypothetical protein [Mesorhizobium opportunistum]|uniref:hypothetical protein n=1 Tax=Mesorhizobium opportunistum TaxID=593909 RepID=UPI00333C397C